MATGSGSGTLGEGDRRAVRVVTEEPTRRKPDRCRSAADHRISQGAQIPTVHARDADSRPQRPHRDRAARACPRICTPSTPAATLSMTSSAKWGSRTVSHRYTRRPPFLCGLASWRNQAFHKKGFHISSTRRTSMSQIGYYKNSGHAPREADRSGGHVIIGRLLQRNAHHGICARTIPAVPLATSGQVSIGNSQWYQSRRQPGLEVGTPTWPGPDHHARRPATRPRWEPTCREAMAIFCRSSVGVSTSGLARAWPLRAAPRPVSRCR